MKTFKTFLVASLVALFSTSAFASAGMGGGKNATKLAEANAAKTELYDQLKKEISYQSFAVDQGLEGRVYVNFKVSDMGGVEVISVSGTDTKLTSHVKNALNGSDVKADPLVIGKEFTTKFEFIIVQ